MQKGRVKYFNADRGFGFIYRPDAADVFVHATDVEGHRNLAKGMEVEYEIGTNDRDGREMAVNVRVLNAEHRGLADAAFMQGDRE